MKKIFKWIVLLPGNIINWYFDFYTGRKKRPIFFNKESTQKELVLCEENFDVILKELENVQKHFELPAYEEVDEFQYDAAKPKTKWKVFVVNMMGIYPKLAQDLCPKTCEIVQKIPNVFQVMFSVLEPGRSIPAHKGPYKGYLRYHLGMKIPNENPPTIRIEKEYYTWKRGESVIFDDSWDHEVYNESKEERVVFIVDIFRPMPKIPDMVNKFLTKHVIRNGYAKTVLKNNEKYLAQTDKTSREKVNRCIENLI